MDSAVYIRWSTEDQGSGTTLDVQRDSCLRYATDKGWTVAPEYIYIDDGVSGAKETRPALSRLNHAIQQVRDAVTLLRSWDGLNYAQRKQVVHLLTVRVEWCHHSHQVTLETTI